MKKNRVSATLKFGLSASKQLISYIVCLMVILGIFLVALFIVFAYEKEYNLLAVSAVFFIATLVPLAIALTSLLNMKKEIKLWMQDAIETDAYCVCVDKRIFTSMILVTFNYKGEKKSITSNGYSWIFNKYVNQQIKILYSPKYGEVMILKKNKVNS